jgi:hypothetical protein
MCTACLVLKLDVSISEFSEEAEEALIRRMALTASVPRAQILYASEPTRGCTRVEIAFVSAEAARAVGARSVEDLSAALQQRVISSQLSLLPPGGGGGGSGGGGGGGGSSGGGGGSGNGSTGGGGSSGSGDAEVRRSSSELEKSGRMPL